MPEQIHYAADLAGKTIVRATWGTCADGRLGLVFDDDTFAILCIQRGWEAGDQEIEFDLGYDYRDLAWIGMISREEKDRIDREIADADAKRAAAEQEEIDRREYERLKAKFESTTGRKGRRGGSPRE